VWLGFLCTANNQIRSEPRRNYQTAFAMKELMGNIAGESLVLDARLPPLPPCFKGFGFISVYPRKSAVRSWFFFWLRLCRAVLQGFWLYQW
jgi:hypothetical protein